MLSSCSSARGDADTTAGCHTSNTRTLPLLCTAHRTIIHVTIVPFGCTRVNLRGRPDDPLVRIVQEDLVWHPSIGRCPARLTMILDSVSPLSVPLRFGPDVAAHAALDRVSNGKGRAMPRLTHALRPPLPARPLRPLPPARSLDVCPVYIPSAAASRFVTHADGTLALVAPRLCS